MNKLIEELNHEREFIEKHCARDEDVAYSVYLTMKDMKLEEFFDPNSSSFKIIADIIRPSACVLALEEASEYLSKGNKVPKNFKNTIQEVIDNKCNNWVVQYIANHFDKELSLIENKSKNEYIQHYIQDRKKNIHNSNVELLCKYKKNTEAYKGIER